MKKFIVIYHAPDEASKKKAASFTSEQMKEGMKSWMDWAQKCGMGLVDIGRPLANGMKVTKDGVSKSLKEVMGYSVLQAETMEEAVAMLKNHPHNQWVDGCSIEVHESTPLPGM